MITFLTSALIAATALASTGAPDMAEQAAETRIAAVRYSDLDLTNERDQRRLDGRIQAAARNVCGMHERITGSAVPTASARTCYMRTMESLDREVAAATGYQPQRG